METRIKERCIYCGGDIYYNSGEQLVKCSWCGEALITAKFENEITRMKQTREENALVKEKLEKAEAEKVAADKRLFATLSSLKQIQSGQDTLGKVLHLIAGKQGDAVQQLKLLHSISEQLVSSQNDSLAFVDVLQEIRKLLQNFEMDVNGQREFMNEFMIWSRQIREEDAKRLEQISQDTGVLLEEQKRILGDFEEKWDSVRMRELDQLYRQATDYQCDQEYDKAEEYYRRVLAKGGETPEVYWRLLMCHYCLSYQLDDRGRQIPIIMNPDLSDPEDMSLRQRLEENLTEKDKDYYHEKLQKIDSILDQYRLLKDKVQYDVFISVKQVNAGHYTDDSDIASDLYDFLKNQGLTVFNSRRTIIPPGQEYEPYIISALMSAKVMIVIGTNSDNMNSDWVKNEWSRFQWLQHRDNVKMGKTDRVLICFLARGMRAEQIPRALNPNRQAICDGVKAHDELLHALSFLPKQPDSAVEIRIQNESIVQENAISAVNQMLTPAERYLLLAQAAEEKKDYAEAVKWYRKAAVSGDADAQNMLGKCYEEGRGVTANQSEATRWYQRAAEQEHVNGQYNYARCLLNRKEAIKWYRRAAEAGDPAAQDKMGHFYEWGGDGVSANQAIAVSWYKAAAEQGYVDGQIHYADSLIKGYGVQKNLSEAAEWYKKAAEQGSEEAKRRLKYMPSR